MLLDLYKAGLRRSGGGVRPLKYIEFPRYRVSPSSEQIYWAFIEGSGILVRSALLADRQSNDLRKQ